MTRDELISRIGAACTVLELERLRRVAKVAYEQLEHQKRAIALQAQLDPFWADSDTPTAADPAVRGTSPEGKVGAEPDCVVYAPGQE